MISGSDDKSIKIFNFYTKQLICNFENIHANFINSLSISVDDKFLISGSEDHSIKVFDLEVMQEIFHLQNAHTSKFIFFSSHFTSGPIYSVAITTDNRYIISGSLDCAVKVFNLPFANPQELNFCNLLLNSFSLFFKSRKKSLLIQLSGAMTTFSLESKTLILEIRI